jgi:hypothetical protein
MCVGGITIFAMGPIVPSYATTENAVPEHVHTLYTI